MWTDLQHIITNLDNNLDLLKTECFDLGLHAEKAIGPCNMAYVELKQLVIDCGFEDRNDEISFFKSIKPVVTSKLIFYRKLLKIVSRRPGFNKVLQKDFLIKETHKLQCFFKENAIFLEYFRRKRNSYDDIYFRRSNVEIVINNDSCRYLVDPEFSTIHDGTVAHIMAFEQLEKYLDNEIQKLGREIKLQDKENTVKDYARTDKKVNPAELAYAFSELGVINHGKIGLAELATILSRNYTD